MELETLENGFGNQHWSIVLKTLENGSIGKWKHWKMETLIMLEANNDRRMVIVINIGPHRYIIQPQVSSVFFMQMRWHRPLVA